MRLVGLVQAAAVITVVFSFVTALPVNDFALQLFTHFRLQYLVVSVLLLLLMLAIRQHAYAAMLLVAAAVSGRNTP